jgi:1-acyl-sn-glycerol-3-phosphate acyltransferase
MGSCGREALSALCPRFLHAVCVRLRPVKGVRIKRVNIVRGVASTVAMALNTLVGVSALLPFALVKLLIRPTAVRKPVDRVLNAIAELWIRNNDALLRDTRWDVRGVEGLERKRWYLAMVNHQSWSDIFVLQKVLTGRIPLLKFFLKQELIWVPVIGLGWWALDFPFMKRHSPEFLRKYPERRGDDLAAIRRACEKFSLIPTAVVNFVEGTRFSTQKRDAEGSPYRHLLAPKAGGIGLALDAMGERFHSLLDVTIFYPAGAPSFFGMLAGAMKEVVVVVRELPIPRDLVGGNYAADPAFRSRLQEWIGQLWREKDQNLDELHRQRAAPEPSRPAFTFDGRS